MTVKRMDNVGIVVEDIDAAIEFFNELGLELEGRAPIEGDWAGGVTGLRGMRVEIAMMRTPDGHSRRAAFAEPDERIVDVLHGEHDAQVTESVHRGVSVIGDHGRREEAGQLEKLVGEVVRYENMYRLCYIRGPEGILIGLAQQLGQQTSRENPLGRNR